MALTAKTATDSGVILNLTAAFFAFSFILALFGKSVSVGPGQMAVTETELPFNSCEREREKWRTNVLEEEYMFIIGTDW